MGYILHIDTSGDIGSIAISSNGRIIALVESSESRNHAALINEMIQDACNTANIKLAEIESVAVCSGPGSYTGLRIAMATAKGVCYALSIPLLSHDRLSLLAGNYVTRHNIDKSAHVAAILLARENEYFLVIRNSSNMNIVPPKHVDEAEMLELLRKSESLHIISNLPVEHFYKLSVAFSNFQENISIDYNYWAEFAQKKSECHEYVDLMTASPLYLKQVFTRN